MIDSLLSEDPIFFDRDDPNFQLFRKIIKKQGEITCRDQFDKGYINSCLTKFTHGFILLGSNLNGRLIVSTTDRYYLRGYVLFEYDSRLAMVNGKIICAIKSTDPKKKIGKILLESVYQFILENRVETWRIFSLPSPKLVAYYESFGFKQHTTLYVRGKAKVVEMNITLTYTEDNVNDSFIIDNICEFDDSEEEL